MACYKQYDLEHIKKLTPIPKCVCGGMIRPDVVLYGESLVNDVINKCYQVLKQTNLLIVAGTQLSVSTAAGVVNMFSGKHLVILNDTPTPYDHLATLVIREELTNIFKHL
jgi:NAD-dependent deacetylase